MRNIKKFTGKENHFVTLAEINEFTRNYRKTFGDHALPGGFFDKNTVCSLIEQKDAVGMRYYYGHDAAGQSVLILTGATAGHQDLLDEEKVFVSTLNPAMSAEGVYRGEDADHQIALQTAAQLTANYRAKKSSDQPKGGFFGREAIHAILNQENCIGLRFYFGANENEKRVLCLMGVDIVGKDMFNGVLAEKSAWCPPFCGDFNPLNSNRFQRAGANELPSTASAIPNVLEPEAN